MTKLEIAARKYAEARAWDNKCAKAVEDAEADEENWARRLGEARRVFDEAGQKSRAARSELLAIAMELYR